MMVMYVFCEVDWLGFKIVMYVCDGFVMLGGLWIMLEFLM